MRSTSPRSGFGIALLAAALLLVHSGMPVSAPALPAGAGPTSAKAVTAKPPPKKKNRQDGNKAEPDRPGNVSSPFTEDERRLLKLASVKFYHNQQCVFPGDPFAQLDLVLRYALIPLPSWEAELAHLIVFMQDEGSKVAQNVSLRKQFFNKAGAAYGKAVLDAMGRAVVGDDKELSLQEFRRGPGRGFEDLGDELRASEIMKAKALVLMHLAAWAIADHVEAHFAPKLSRQALAAETGLVFYPHRGDRIGIPGPDGQRAFMPGWFIKIVHQGQQPLTNVLLTARLRTSGPNTTLTSAQRSAITLNQVTGFEDKVPDITELFKAQNLHESMPKRFFVYVPELRPGDVVEMPIGVAQMEWAPSATLSLHADQGRLQELPFALTKWMDQGATKELPPVVRHGASRHEIIGQLGELLKADRQEWLKVGKAANTVPEEADCWSWGGEPYKPKVFLAFRADRLEHYELIIPPRPKPAVAGIPLVFNARGIATVKSTIDREDPEHRRLHTRHKVYTANLKAGMAYVLTMSSPTGSPFIELENTHGDTVGTRAKEVKPPRPELGKPVGPQLNEVRATFTPKEDGEYRIVCCWKYRSDRPGAFTLTVQPESTVARPKLPSAGTLRFDAAGTASVKSAIAASDPKHPRLGAGLHHHKAFTVELEAGKTYQIKMISTAGTPLFELEDRDGEALGRGSPIGNPSTQKPGVQREATMTFRPEQSGTFRIICVWAFPQEKPGPFSLTIQGK